MGWRPAELRQELRSRLWSEWASADDENSQKPRRRGYDVSILEGCVAGRERESVLVDRCHGPGNPHSTLNLHALSTCDAMPTIYSVPRIPRSDVESGIYFSKAFKF